MTESEDIPWNREPREIIQEGYYRIYLRHAFNSFFLIQDTFPSSRVCFWKEMSLESCKQHLYSVHVAVFFRRYL